VGDEALMHARAFTGRVPVVIARSRARGAQLIEKEKLGNVIVLDDGLQHHGLGRELNILLLDASSKQSIARWETGALLPAGWLRERLEDALGRTDCIVFTYKAVAKQIENKELEKPVPQFSFVFMPDHFTEFASDKKIALEKLHGGSFAAFSSIAAPEHFFNMLRQMNFDIQRTYGFADHHLFSERELAEIFSSGLPLICTEKDAVKIPADYPKSQEVFILALKGEFSSAGAKEGFSRFVLEKLQERSGALVERETAP